MEWLISESDEEPLRWRPIRDCHASRFRELVLRAIAGHEKEADIRAIMQGLYLRYRQDRWYVCVQLLERGIPLPGRAPGKEGLAEWRLNRCTSNESYERKELISHDTNSHQY